MPSAQNIDTKSLHEIVQTYQSYLLHYYFHIQTAPVGEVLER